jgi:hypothetical protein
MLEDMPSLSSPGPPALDLQPSARLSPLPPRILAWQETFGAQNGNASAMLLNATAHCTSMIEDPLNLRFFARDGRAFFPEQVERRQRLYDEGLSYRSCMYAEPSPDPPELSYRSCMYAEPSPDPPECWHAALTSTHTSADHGHAHAHPCAGMGGRWAPA